MAAWKTGLQCLLNAITPLTYYNLKQIIYIRNQVHTVTGAIN